MERRLYFKIVQRKRGAVLRRGRHDAEYAHVRYDVAACRMLRR